MNDNFDCDPPEYQSEEEAVEAELRKLEKADIRYREQKEKQCRTSNTRTE